MPRISPTSANETISKETGDYCPFFYNVFARSTQSAETQETICCVRAWFIPCSLFTIYGWRGIFLNYKCVKLLFSSAGDGQTVFLTKILMEFYVRLVENELHPKCNSKSRMCCYHLILVMDVSVCNLPKRTDDLSCVSSRQKLVLTEGFLSVVLFCFDTFKNLFRDLIYIFQNSVILIYCVLFDRHSKKVYFYLDMFWPTLQTIAKGIITLWTGKM